jgi:plastocyanin
MIIFTMISQTILLQAEESGDSKSRIVEITIENHKFSPAEIHIAQGESLDLLIHNKDGSAEEFDSTDLRKEKVITSNASATIKLGPLKSGIYQFAGEFHPKTAQGKIIVE